MGERTPYLDPAARGILVGLTASHTRAHVIRAILEGVAFSLRDTLTVFQEIKVPVETVRLGGGGAKSPLWRQIQADVYGRSVEMVEAADGAAYGAAILAGDGAKAWPTADDACKAVVRVAGHVDRSLRDSIVLDKAYAMYRRIYPAMKSILN
jgi:xylulokinase